LYAPNTTTNQTGGLPSGAIFPVGTTLNTFKAIDASGNSTTCSFTVTVTDNSEIYCDDKSKDKKVYVCHNGNTICISLSALQAHLSHGDYLGKCGNNLIARTEIYQGPDPEIAAAIKGNLYDPEIFKVVVSPNPSATAFRITIEGNSNKLISLRVIDEVGRIVTTLTDVHTNTEVMVGKNYRPGIYFAEVIQGANRKMIKLVKSN